MAPNGEWDVLGWQFGLGLPISLFGVDSIVAALNATPGSVIDQLLVGWDGKPERCLEIVRRMLAAAGWFYGIDFQGRIIFARLRMPTVEDVASPTTITPIPRVLSMTTGASEAIDTIRATFGELPWAEGETIEVNALGDADALLPPNSMRAALFSDDVVIDLDLRNLSAAAGSEGDPFDIVSRIEFRSFGAPMLRIRATDPGNISHGDFLKIGDPGLETSWFVDADTGDPIAVDGSVKWFGQVVEFKRNFADGSIDLGMLMHNWFLDQMARLRGPSAIVASVASNVYTCDANAFHDPSGSDVGGFTVGDKVEVFDETGALVSGSKASPDIQEITALDTAANTMTLDAAFTTAPSAGHVIRWARVYNAVGNAEATSAKLSGYLPYTAAAGADGKITPSDLDAHIYGYDI